MINCKKLEKALSVKAENGREIAEALSNFMNIFDKDILSWLGGLFDADIGGFYYSASARDGDRYMPDIESTAQAIAVMRLLGVVDTYDNLPEWMRKGISSFICSCENEHNGLFYQEFEDKIEKREVSTRVGRNFYYATRLAKGLNISLPFSTAIERVRNGEKFETYRMFDDKKGFNEYLGELTQSGGVLRTVCSLCAQKHNIVAYGREAETIEYLESIRNRETGLYGNDVDISAINVLNSALTLYNDFGHQFTDYSKTLEILLENICSYTPVNINHNENIWGAIWRIKENTAMFRSVESQDIMDTFMSRIYKLAPLAIDHLTEKLLEYKRSDGSFSYTLGGSSEYSSGIKVADKNMREGDLNATAIALYTLDEVLKTLNIDPALGKPLSRSDFDLFLSSI